MFAHFYKIYSAILLSQSVDSRIDSFNEPSRYVADGTISKFWRKTSGLVACRRVWTNSEYLQAEELSTLVPLGMNATTTGEDSWKRGSECVRISLRICRKSYSLVRSTILRDFLIVRINDVEVTRAYMCARVFTCLGACVSNGEIRVKCVGSFRESGNIFQALDCTVYVCIAIVTYEHLG